MVTKPWIGLFALALLAGCGNDSNPLPPIGGGDAGGDLVAGGGCSLDAQCGGATPRCDKNSRTCVACLPDNDNCPPGTHCAAQNGSFACSASCRVGADCPKNDGGAQLECCNGTCFDTSADSSHCGGCATVCPAVANGTPACTAGMCGARCEPGFADCDQMLANGCEVDIGKNTAHCGGCGKACPPAQNGKPTCDKGACGITCDAGFAHCSANPADGCEVNLTTDGKNCGACGMACAMVSHAQGACMAGMCAIASCDPGYSDCNKTYRDGCEVDTQSDVAHCGACGAACPAQNANSACAAGRCSIVSCKPGFSNCDGLPINGCEVQSESDVSNCGACARVCMAPNGVPSCMGGVCGIASCAAGFADCNGNAGDGCEVKVSSDLNNCGGCGKACAMVANGAAACVNAQCAVGSCKFGFADCDMNFGNGCEANLLSPQTCGACNIQCPAPAHGTAGCNAGMCGLGMCDAQWGNCDGNQANGCERSLSSDAANCGACNKACALPQAVPQCVNGACGIVSCSLGFADCDMNPQNGCEAQTNIDLKNCGACGKVCPVAPNSSAFCAGGNCQSGCNGGFGDCDKQGNNGCEVNLNTDVNHCNGCGNACAVANGTPGCAGGLCVVTACNMGFADCDKGAGNGCEKNLNTDVGNCGACGKACVLANAVPACVNGACAISQCNAGFGDCDNNPANGCEVNLKTDAKNCGVCGVVCGGMNPVCVNSVCSACNVNVLVITDGNANANSSFSTALKNAFLNPTLTLDNYNYNSVPGAANYGATVVLVGNQVNSDMPVNGQFSIVNAQAAGSGVVFVEFGAYHVQQGRWQTLKNIMLLGRTSGNSVRATFTLTSPNHAVWTGLPNSFVLVNSMGINIGNQLLNNGTQIASCTECMGPGVAVRDNGVGGRIAHIAFAPDYNSAPSAGDLMWGNDTNATRLMVNAVKWAARCQ